MKAKRMLAGVLAAGMVCAVPVTTAWAAKESKGTDVFYDNRNIIPNPDPMDPTNPEWVVSIPSSIHFTDANKEIDASVELIEKTGLPANDVTVTVKSAKGYKLALTGNADPVDYMLSYGSTVMSAGIDDTVAILTAQAPKQAGTARLTGKATAPGTHTDVLTYTVEYTK